MAAYADRSVGANEPEDSLRDIVILVALDVAPFRRTVLERRRHAANLEFDEPLIERRLEALELRETAPPHDTRR